MSLLIPIGLLGGSQLIGDAQVSPIEFSNKGTFAGENYVVPREYSPNITGLGVMFNATFPELGPLESNFDDYIESETLKYTSLTKMNLDESYSESVSFPNGCDKNRCTGMFNRNGFTYRVGAINADPNTTRTLIESESFQSRVVDLIESFKIKTD